MCGRLSSSRVTVPWLVDLRTGSRWVTCRGIAPTRRRMIVIFSVSGAGCHPPFSALLVNTASAVHRLREFTVGKLWLRGRDGFFVGAAAVSASGGRRRNVSHSPAGFEWVAPSWCRAPGGGAHSSTRRPPPRPFDEHKRWRIDADQ